MTYQPQEQCLKDVLILLKFSMAPDTKTQREVSRQFQEFSTNPEFVKSLMYIVSEMPDEDEAIRSRACLNAKNIVHMYHNEMRGGVLEYIKQTSLKSISDQSSLVRKTVGTLISTLFALDSNWPELMPFLSQLLDSSEPSICETAINTVMKICEDTQENRRPNSQLHEISVKILRYVRHDNKSIKTSAMICMNACIDSRSTTFMQNVDYFLNVLFELAEDSDVDVCKQVCQAFIKLLENKVDNLLPHMKGVIEYMIVKTQDENVSLTASEFWHILAEQAICKEVLTPFLPKLVPVLVTNMKLTDMDIALLKGDIDDENIEDRDEDIKPKFHKSKNDDIESDDEEMLGSWNIRKSNAAALDTFAHIFKNDILPFVLPILNETLFHENWIIKESGILALGAISEGCMLGIVPHLNQLMPYLIECINHKRSLIRVITCWTLSRYYEWVVIDPSNIYLEQILSGLLQKMLDTNKKVQESACSALAKLEEIASIKLYCHIAIILKTFVYAFAKYQRKNLTLLYDAVGTLATHVGPYLNNQEYINLLMPPLIDKWNKTSDDDRHLFCLFECITSVAVALKLGFLPFCEPVYKRALILIEKVLNMHHEKEKDPQNDDLPEPNSELIVCSLDLISGLIEALGSQMEPLIRDSNCLSLLYQCSQYSYPEVRQSSFSLLGDMARNCFPSLHQVWGNFVPVVVTNINSAHLPVCNNATWAIGEICVNVDGSELTPYIEPIIKQLLMVVNSGNKILVDIAAIALGRLGNVCPVEVSSVLEQFAHAWCLSAGNIRDRYEKESTFKGMCQVIAIRPMGILKDLHLFCNAIATWENPGDHLKELFSKILHGYKTEFGEENWKKFTDPFSVLLRERLAIYQI